MKLFVGSLPFSMGDKELQELFSQYGVVVSAKVIVDRETGRSRGFGFVEFSSRGEAEKAMKDLDGKAIEGRSIVVNEARENRPTTRR